MHWAPPAYPKTLCTLYKSCHKSSRRLFLTNKHKITVALVTPDRYRAVRTYISLRSLVSGNIYQKEAHWCIKHEKIHANVKGKTILFFSFSKNSFILIIFSVNKVNIFCYFASQVNPSRACFDRRTRDCLYICFCISISPALMNCSWYVFSSEVIHRCAVLLCGYDWVQNSTDVINSHWSVLSIIPVNTHTFHLDPRSWWNIRGLIRADIWLQDSSIFQQTALFNWVSTQS